MSNYRPIDSKREEFRKYLERAGVMDALTKVLVSLYEEADKPDNALDYVRSHLGGGSSDSEELETLKAEFDASVARVEALEEENASLKERLAQYEPPEDAPMQAPEDMPEDEGEPPEAGEPAPEEEGPPEED